MFVTEESRVIYLLFGIQVNFVSFITDENFKAVNGVIN